MASMRTYSRLVSSLTSSSNITHLQPSAIIGSRLFAKSTGREGTSGEELDSDPNRVPEQGAPKRGEEGAASSGKANPPSGGEVSEEMEKREASQKNAGTTDGQGAPPSSDSFTSPSGRPDDSHQDTEQGIVHNDDADDPESDTAQRFTQTKDSEKDMASTG